MRGTVKRALALTSIIMPFEKWPPKERAAWIAAVENQNIIDNDYYAAGWSARTREAICKNYGRWLSWISSNRPAELRLSLLQRTTRGNVISYTEALRHRIKNVSIVGYLDNLRAALRAIAPKSDWSWIGQITSRIRHSREIARDKGPRVVNSQRLIELGLQLISKSQETHGRAYVDTCLGYRDGLIIALLAARPLRTINFINIQIGTNLVQHANGWWLRVNSSETKNRIMIETPVPSELHDCIQHYLTVIRPFLLEQACRPNFRIKYKSARHELWISRRGIPLTAKGFYTMIVRRTKSHFGQTINPHLFRDCLATTLASSHPDHGRVTPLALGHNWAETSQLHYNQTKGCAAAERFRDHIGALRAAMPKLPRR